MEKKTNKEKLEIFKFLRISALSQAIDKIGSYLQILKNMVIMEFLHAELITATKTVQNTTIFVKNTKKLKND